jgi:hypothetical protein
MATMKKTTYGVGNSGLSWGQAQRCCGVKPANGIPKHILLIIVSPTAIQIQ